MFDWLQNPDPLLRTIIETIPHAIWRTNPDGSADYCSDGFRKMVGEDSETVLGWGWLELIHPEDRAQVAADWQKQRDQKLPISIEFRIRTRHQGERWVLSQGNPFFDSSGEMTKYYGTWTDIQDRIIAEQSRGEEIFIQQQRVRFFAESIPQMSFMADPDEIVTYFNQRWYDYVGMQKGETEGWDWKNRPIHHPDDLERCIQVWNQAVRTGEPYEVEYRLRRHDGEYRWHLGRAIAHRDESGQIVQWYGTNTDIHDQKTFSEDMARAKQSAEEASRAKTAFLANMSHEIRTPLAAIIGFSELLQTSAPQDEDRELYLSRITRNAHQLRSLVDELLDLAKIEANRLDIERMPIDLNTVLEDAYSSVSLRAREKGIEFLESRAKNLPHVVVTDPTRLRQILINILGNAVKFTERGRIQVRTEMQVRGSHHLLQVKVSDTGIGLTEEQQSRIFRPFSQGDNSITRKYGGTGLGLSLSKRLARLLGGDLFLESSVPGKGSSFVLTIDSGTSFDVPEVQPKGSSNRSPEGQGSPEMRPVVERPLAGFRILIVDDSADNQTLISLILQRAGATFDYASNGEEAIHQALEGFFDLILMDLQMPGVDGTEALLRLKDQGYQRPIIALTAHALKSERDRCLAVGFSEYITKPIDRPLLVQRIRELITEFGPVRSPN